MSSSFSFKYLSPCAVDKSRILTFKRHRYYFKLSKSCISKQEKKCDTLEASYRVFWATVSPTIQRFYYYYLLVIYRFVFKVEFFVCGANTQTVAVEPAHLLMIYEFSSTTIFCLCKIYVTLTCFVQEHIVLTKLINANHFHFLFPVQFRSWNAACVPDGSKNECRTEIVNSFRK